MGAEDVDFFFAVVVVVVVVVVGLAWYESPSPACPPNVPDTNAFRRS